MLSLTAAFWIMVLLFSFVGTMRGWTKEVIVTLSVALGVDCATGVAVIAAATSALAVIHVTNAVFMSPSLSDSVRMTAPATIRPIHAMSWVARVSSSAG